jgi:hypothetical protein
MPYPATRATGLAPADLSMARVMEKLRGFLYATAPLAVVPTLLLPWALLLLAPWVGLLAAPAQYLGAAYLYGDCLEPRVLPAGRKRAAVWALNAVFNALILAAILWLAWSWFVLGRNHWSAFNQGVLLSLALLGCYHGLATVISVAQTLFQVRVLREEKQQPVLPLPEGAVIMRPGDFGE